jgi:hypothetical protein
VNYLLLVWLAVSTAACQVLSGASSLSVEDPAPPGMRMDPMHEEADAGKPIKPIMTDEPDDAGPPRAGQGGQDGQGGRGGAGGAGQGGSPSEPVAGSAGAPAAGSGGTAAPGASPVQPCTKDEDCNGRKCLRQGWCELTCGDNSRCGTSISGAPNLCGSDYPDPTKSFCYAGCNQDSDCAAYPQTTCQTVIGALDMKTCEVPSSAGYPCNNDQNCALPLICINELWCSPNPCETDADCGTSPHGVQNYCLLWGQTNLCSPGCRTKDDCVNYAGTVCRAIGTVFVCLPPPEIGSPCHEQAECGDFECIGAWCSPASCSDDESCGQTSAGNPNRCIATADDNNKICFPGCKTNSDCAAFEESTCQPVSTGRTEMVCSRRVVGTPCDENVHCGSDGWICAGLPGWCTPTSCDTDADCNSTEPTTPPNRCIENANSKKTCFPGCSTDNDCAAYPNTVCSSGTCTAP